MALITLQVLTNYEQNLNTVVVELNGTAGRRRDCHLMAPPVPEVCVSIGINRGCQ